MRNEEIDSEIENRARAHLGQTHLVADYYRIRRRVAYPLPVRALSIPGMPVARVEAYPWSIWMLWDLEERIHALGWYGHAGSGEARSAVLKDVEALTTWPDYRQFEQPDLSLGHSGRLIWYAAQAWPWLGEALADPLDMACERLVVDGLPYSDAMHGAYRSATDILVLDEPHSVLHNIPLIGTVGIALCASRIDHPRLPDLNARLTALFGAFLELRKEGHTEGVGYDGYILDFIAPWLTTLPDGDRQAILSHPRFDDLIDESIGLGAPGDVAQVAEIGDVEPREMPYHLSGHAKVLRWTDDGRRRWLLNRARLDWLRTDALAELRALPESGAGTPPSPGVIDAHYAVCLRTGWDHEDLAVAMSCSNSRMGHLQVDTGTVVIGNRGEWVVSDPGYQQYLKKAERTFTLGPTAHNVPVIAGQAMSAKPAKRCFKTDEMERGSAKVAIDLSDCYPDAHVSSVTREVWLAGPETIVIHDAVRPASDLTYHWHGHPEAAWNVEERVGLIYLNGVATWVACVGHPLSDRCVDRLPGSRGQVTLNFDVHAEDVWWVFVVGRRPEVEANGSGIKVNGTIYKSDAGA